MGPHQAAHHDLQALMKELEAEFPSFRLIPKERSGLMRLVYYGMLMFLWCPEFMTGYTTVIVTRVYMPTDLMGTAAAYGVLRHERVHMRDCLSTGVVPFALSYLFLLPAGLTMRSIWEMRAYAETMRVERELSGRVSDKTLERIERQFTSSAYLWMCPFPGLVRRWLHRVRHDVLSERSNRAGSWG